MRSRIRPLLWLCWMPLLVAGELTSVGSRLRTQEPDRETVSQPFPPLPGYIHGVRDPESLPQVQLVSEADFCLGLHKLLEASADGFRSVTHSFKETPTGVLEGLGTVQLPGAVLCTAVQHLIHGDWKASYTCHFAGDDETVSKAEADRRFEGLKQQTRSCVPKELVERDETGGEDLGVVSTEFVGDQSGPIVTVFLNYNGGSAEHPSTIDLWLRVARSIPADPKRGRPAEPSPSSFDRRSFSVAASVPPLPGLSNCVIFRADTSASPTGKNIPHSFPLLPHGDWNPNLD